MGKTAAGRSQALSTLWCCSWRCRGAERAAELPEGPARASGAHRARAPARGLLGPQKGSGWRGAGRGSPRGPLSHCSGVPWLIPMLLHGSASVDCGLQFMESDPVCRSSRPKGSTN